MNTAIILAVAVVVLYLVVSLLLGLAASWGRQYGSEDYFLAGRSLPWFAVALSIAGTSFGLESLLGMIGLAYTVGLTAASFAWGNFFALSVLLWVFLPFFYRKKVSGTAEFLERRYCSSTRAVFSLVALVTLLLGVLVPALYVGGWALCEAGLGIKVDGFSWTFAACIATVAIVTAIYSVYGGLMAGVWTSAFQLLVVLAGGILLAVVAVQGAGGLEAITESNLSPRLDLLLPTKNPTLPWTGVLAFWFVMALWNAGANPITVQRCLGARSEWDAKMGVIVAGLLQVGLAAIIVLPGLAAFTKLGAQYAHGMTTDRAAMKIIEELFGHERPVWALGQGLVVSAVLAAVMSTVSGVLNALSSIWTMDVCQDLLQRNASEAEMVGRGRLSSFVLLVLGVLLTPIFFVWEKGILDFILSMASILGPPVAVVALVGFFWPRAHGRAATVTLVFGVAAGIMMWVIADAGQVVPEWIRPVLNRAGIGGVLSLVVFGLGTFAIPQNPEELYDPNTTWSLQWSRLPPYEREQGAGPRNLVFWWLVMILVTATAWMMFK